MHTHNVSSSRGRGDLDVQPLPSQPRLAEPPDEPGNDGRVLTMTGAPDEGRSPALPRFPPAGWPCRHPQPRPGRSHRHLLIGCRGAHRGGGPPLATALPHLAGCGQLGPDMRLTHETLRPIAATRTSAPSSSWRSGASRWWRRCWLMSPAAVEASGDRRHPIGRGHRPRDGKGDRHRAAFASTLATGDANGATCRNWCCR